LTGGSIGSGTRASNWSKHSRATSVRVASQIEREGDRVGVVLHDGRLSEQPRLVGGILTAAALSAEIARLRVEVRIQLQEVEASRARIVEAGYEERRRLERDLHDGAQQRLVSLGLELRRMQRTLPAEATVLAPALDRVVNEIGSAIRDLRQIAAGVRPTRLDDGLAAALHDLARTAPLPVEVDARIDRVAASVEAAAFFVACEAVTNAVKHAAASKVAVRATRENGSLVLTIADDGVGGATARRGSGLAGLQDRVSALRGELRITSPDGGGTRVDVVIPCAS
jgi:signal transduction histidine kinase